MATEMTAWPGPATGSGMELSASTPGPPKRVTSIACVPISGSPCCVIPYRHART